MMDHFLNNDRRASLDLWSLYELMFKSRTFEEAVRQIWKDCGISGEMHLGLGEEASTNRACGAGWRTSPGSAWLGPRPRRTPAG